MLTLSEETESLAQRLAQAENLPVDDIVRRALEQRARSAGVRHGTESGRVSDEEIARRLAFTRDIQAKIAALPTLDPMSPEEIMDEINEV